MANSILAKMAVQITANTAQLNAALKQSSSAVSKFQSSIADAAKGFVAGFGAMQIAGFALDISKLAGEAEGVKRAFDKLPDSVNILRELKDVTRGTVSELELMKRAVTATNFGIQLESLPKLLEFATVRAQQTGQSVDYLVDSIVTGIGRKSPLILDNLGISTTRLKEQFNGAALEAQSIADVAAAVGKIAEEELTKMGSVVETNSTKLQRLNAEWVNLKVAIGGSSAATFGFSSIIDSLTSQLQILTDVINNGFKKALVDAFPFLSDLIDTSEHGASVTWDNVKATTEDTKAINENTNAVNKNVKSQEGLFEISEKARQARIKGLEEELANKFKLQSYQGKIGKEGLTGFTNISPEALSSATAFAQAQNAISNAVDTANLKQKQQIDIIMMQREAWASLGNQMGIALGETIAASEGIAQTVKRLGLSIINTLEQITLARMIEKNSKYGIPGIIAAAAGFGIVKGLFNKIKGSGGSVNAGSTRVGRTDLGSRVEFEIRGENLYGVLTNYQRNSRLTTAGG
jgi:hypothetical protein